MTRPVGASPRWGGWLDAAELLSTDERPISRQLVYMWWSRRHRNGFPDLVNPEVVRASGGAPRVRGAVLDLEAVRTWYEGYEPSHGGRPRKYPDLPTAS